MKYCSNCGKPSDDGALFCGECGFSFAGAPAPAQQANQAQAPGDSAQMSYGGQSYGGGGTQPYGGQGTQTYGGQGTQAYGGQGAQAYGGQGTQAYGSQGAQPYGSQGAQAYGGQGAQPYGGAQGAQSYGDARGAQTRGKPGKRSRAGAKKQGGKSRLPLIIGIAVAVIAVAVLAIILLPRLFGGGSASDFVGSQLSFAEKRVNFLTEDVAKDSFSSDVTITAAIDGSGEITDVLSEVLEDSSVVVKIDSSSKKLLLNAALYLKGSNILEGFLSVTPDQIGFSVPNADETYYVANIADLMESMDMDMADFELDVNAGEVKTDMDAIVKRYRDLLAKQISRDKLHIEKRRDVKLSEVGKTVKCTVMVWEPEDDIIALLEALADTLEKDEQLGKLLSVAAASEGYDSGLEMLEEAADNLRDNADYMAENLVDSGFKWTVALDGRNELTMVSVEAGDNEVIFERAVDSKSGAEALYVNEYGSERFMLTNEYTVSGSRRSGAFVLDTYRGEISLDYDVDISKKSVFGIPYGIYTPDLGNLIPGVDLEISVADGAGGSTDHVVSISGLSGMTDGMVKTVDVTINTTKKSSVKEPSGRKEDISDYDADDFEDLFDELGSEIGNALMESPEIQDLMESLMRY